MLKWYFDEQQATQRPETHKDPPTAEVGDPPVQQINIGSLVDGTRRVTFAELVRAGFLKQGNEIYCKSLKRQQRAGSEAFIKAAKVADNGTVDFMGRRFSNPSKLAMAMVNATGGDAKALNGYDYLFVLSDEGRPLPLEELRRRLIEGTPAEQCAVNTLLEDTDAFGNASEALDYVRQNNGFPGTAR